MLKDAFFRSMPDAAQTKFRSTGLTGVLTETGRSRRSKFCPVRVAGGKLPRFRGIDERGQQQQEQQQDLFESWKKMMVVPPESKMKLVGRRPRSGTSEHQ